MKACLAALAALHLCHAPPPDFAMRGIASVYGYEAGRQTASGERLDVSAMTGAHRSLPFGSRVRVTTRAGRSVVVRINDRGPWRHGRIIDLTTGAARALGFSGLAEVTLEVE